MMFLIRFCAASTSVYIFTQFMPNPATVLWIYFDCNNEWSSFCETYSSRYSELRLAATLFVTFLWLAVWFHLEMKNRHRVGRPSKVLTHLRYGPIATMIVGIAAIIAFDALLIQYSRWEIVHYIHSNASLAQQPTFKLHNNYRHWCGNGMAAAEYELYGDVPEPYFDSPDAVTRARALRASMAVYDWINHPADGPSTRVLKRAVNDPDPLVKKIALEFQSDMFDEPPR